jgi:large subunit ribosomal protein L28
VARNRVFAADFVTVQRFRKKPGFLDCGADSEIWFLVRCFLTSVTSEILQQCQQGDFSWGRAGLFNLFASFKAVGEPAPTGPTRMVPDLSYIRYLHPLPNFPLPSAIMRGCTQKNGNLEGNMSRKCQLTGKKANNGFAVSHSHRRTHKLQEANLQWKRIWWPQEKRWVKLHLSTKAIKTLQHKGLEIMAREAGINLYKM